MSNGLPFAITVIALLLTACGKPQPEADGPEYAMLDPAPADALTDAASATAVQQATAMSNAEALKRLPAWAPAYPGGKVESSMMRETAGTMDGMVSFVSADKPDAVVAFYRSAMARNGLILETEAASSQGMIIAGRTRDGRTLMVTAATRDDRNTSIAIVLGKSHS